MFAGIVATDWQSSDDIGRYLEIGVEAFGRYRIAY
jgi:hypothetical protein